MEVFTSCDRTRLRGFLRAGPELALSANERYSAYACLQWACASIGAVLVTLNPAYRIPELVRLSLSRYIDLTPVRLTRSPYDASPLYLLQVSTLNLVGVTHLFVVPRLRSSAYVRALCAAFPALANSPPGAIQEEALPALRHLIVVDNLSSALFGSGSAREGARAPECASSRRRQGRASGMTTRASP